MTVLELMEEAQRDLESSLQAKPEVEAGVRLVMARTHANMMMWPDTVPDLRRAIALYRGLDLTEAPDPAPAPPVSEPSGPTELAASAVAEDLFAGNQLGMDVTKTFEERYQDRPVRWCGKLERVDSYYSDFVFGSTPGAKANIEIYELRDEPYGNATIRAVVQLTQEEGESLRARTGDTIAFEGQLVRCEPYMRNLLVAHGRLV